METDQPLETPGNHVEQTEPLTPPTNGALYDPETDPGASFDKVAQAYFYRHEKWSHDPANRAYWAAAYEPRRAEFQEQYGVIRQEYFCSQFIAAAVLTEQDRLFIVCNERSDDAAAILGSIREVRRLDIEAGQFLSDDELRFERRTIADMLYSIITHCLLQLEETLALPPDERAHARSSATPFVAEISEQVAYARNFYSSATQRTAQIHYFKGMIWTAAIVYALSLVLGIALATVLDGPRATLSPFLATFVAGATGAVVSVLSRMTFGKLNLNHTVGWSQLRYLGIFRPLIGGILGVAIFVAFAGGLLDIVSPRDPSRALFFYAALAFIAGFSERWAQDMLSLTPKGTTEEGAATTLSNG